MGDLKPIGSEKLSSDAKLKRILELTYYQSSVDLQKPVETVKETKTGVYGIVKENDGFYVKRGLNENSLDYIGGLFMKNKNRFPSHIEAVKKMAFLIEQENLEEATKYILKRPKPEPKPQEEAPAPMPTGEMPPPAATPDDTTMPPTGEEMPPSPDDLGADETPSPDGEEEYLKIIQKLSGKLGEKLRDYEDKIKSDDIKYVLNMIISAVDLNKLEETDKEDILNNFDPEEETSDEEIPGDDASGEETPPPAEDEGELGETDGMAALEELISTNPFNDEGDYPLGPEPIDFDDEDDDLSGIEDKSAEEYASHDYEEENPEDDLGLSDMTKSPDDMLDDKEEETDENMSPTPEEEEGISTSDEVREIDLDELNNMITMGVKETLGKYFE